MIIKFVSCELIYYVINLVSPNKYTDITMSSSGNKHYIILYDKYYIINIIYNKHYIILFHFYNFF